MKKIKNILCCILAVAMVITVAVPSTVEAASYKSELKSLQKKTEKQVNKYKKQWQSEKKKYKSQTKGTVTIIGTIESRDPYIVYDSLRKSYYWIENSKYMDSMITSTSGYVKVTGKTKKWNNVTCAVAKAVKVTANPAKYEQLYKDASKKLKEIKNALKNTLTVYYEGTVIKNNDEVPIYITVDNLIDTKYKYNTKYSNYTYSYDSSILDVYFSGQTLHICPLDGIEAGTKTDIKICDEVTGKEIIINIVVEEYIENEEYDYEDY